MLHPKSIAFWMVWCVSLYYRCTLRLSMQERYYKNWYICTMVDPNARLGTCSTFGFLFNNIFLLIAVFSIGSNLLLPSLCDGRPWTGQKVLPREVEVLESASCPSPWRHAVVHYIPENHTISAKLVYQLGLANHWGTTDAILLGNILR